jgi:Protein of unknown function (DUF2939)
LQARDAAALGENIHMPALRRSLSQQVLLSYAKLTGATARLGPFEQIAARVAANMADPLVSQLVDPKNLFDLLDKGWPSQVTSEGQPAHWGGVSVDISRVWQLYLNSEYSGRDYYVSVPVTAPRLRQFRLNLRLIAGRWKLVGIDLPEELSMALARELVKQSQS